MEAGFQQGATLSDNLNRSERAMVCRSADERGGHAASARVAVIGQFKPLMIAVLAVGPLVPFLHKPGSDRIAMREPK